jgi:hypothetical protein
MANDFALVIELVLIDIVYLLKGPQHFIEKKRFQRLNGKNSVFME